MLNSVILRGYRYSVYNRIARVALHEKGVSYTVDEVDPFATDVSRAYLGRHPFGRVPVLSHGAFDIFETSAITRYIDAAFVGADLVPKDAEALARMAQVISIVDNYGYWPMIRQVFAHRVFLPAEGAPSDDAEITAGIEASKVVLRALDAIATEGKVLGTRGFSLADCHLAPMIAYFVQAPEGADTLGVCPALLKWWAAVSQRDSLKDTDPGLPNK